MYEIYYDGECIMKTNNEQSVACFLFGVSWGHGDNSTIIDYLIVKDGCAVLKTTLINKYFPKSK